MKNIFPQFLPHLQLQLGQNGGWVTVPNSGEVMVVIYVNINHLFHEVPLVTPEQAVGMHYFNQRYNMKTTAGIFRMKSRWEGFTKYKDTVHVDTLFLF